MSERRIGFIPGAVNFDQQDCGVFVTDRRTIVVVNKQKAKGFKAELKAEFGAEADRLPDHRPSIDFATVDIDTLAAMPGNSWVEHTALEKVTIGKGIGGYGIWAQYTGENMKKDYLIVQFIAPPALVKRKKAEGIGAKETKRQYALRCQEVFRKALPPIIAEKVDWKI